MTSKLRFRHEAKLASRKAEVRRYLDALEARVPLRIDKRFAYELMGAEGICLVPLSGFSSPLDGFRMTLLEEDAGLHAETCRRIRRAAEAFFR
jgi:alanine-synthesizing transaminase